VSSCALCPSQPVSSKQGWDKGVARTAGFPPPVILDALYAVCSTGAGRNSVEVRPPPYFRWAKATQFRLSPQRCDDFGTCLELGLASDDPLKPFTVALEHAHKQQEAFLKRSLKQTTAIAALSSAKFAEQKTYPIVWTDSLPMLGTLPSPFSLPLVRKLGNEREGPGKFGQGDHWDCTSQILHAGVRLRGIQLLTYCKRCWPVRCVKTITIVAPRWGCRAASSIRSSTKKRLLQKRKMGTRLNKAYRPEGRARAQADVNRARAQHWELIGSRGPEGDRIVGKTENFSGLGPSQCQGRAFLAQWPH